jgi:hypothetical protein
MNIMDEATRWFGHIAGVKITEEEGPDGPQVVIEYPDPVEPTPEPTPVPTPEPQTPKRTRAKKPKPDPGDQ